MKGNIQKRILVGTVLFGVLLFFTSPLLADGTIIDEWTDVKAPKAHAIKPVKVDAKVTALLVLDIEKRTCNAERRPRCIASVPKIKTLITKARAAGIPVVYSLTSKGTPETILKEVAPLKGEKIVKSSVDKFYGTDLEKVLSDKGIKTVIIVGTAANGAIQGGFRFVQDQRQRVHRQGAGQNAALRLVETFGISGQ